MRVPLHSSAFFQGFDDQGMVRVPLHPSAFFQGFDDQGTVRVPFQVENPVYGRVRFAISWTFVRRKRRLFCGVEYLFLMQSSFGMPSGCVN